MMLQLTPKTHQLNRLSAYYAAQLLTKEWMQPTDEPHEIFPVTITESKARPRGMARSAVTAYGVHRPDKQWAVLAINKGPRRSAQLNVQFRISGAQQPVSFVGKVEILQFSRTQYSWHAAGPNGHPIRSLPPTQFTQTGSSSYELPPYSISVIRGTIADQ